MAHSNGGAPPGGYGAPPGGYGPPPGGYGPPPGGGYGPPPGGVDRHGTPLPPGIEPATPPPPGAFGQPAPYNMAPPPAFAIPVRGSFGIGFLLGVFAPCVGVGLVYALAKGPDTKRGAVVGFGIFLVLCAISQVLHALAR